MRARAGTTLALSTVAKTAFSSATVVGATTKVSWASARWASSASAVATTIPVRINALPQYFGINPLSCPAGHDYRLGASLWRRAGCGVLRRACGTQAAEIGRAHV